MEGLIQTRGLLEFTVRRRVEALPNVTARYATKVADPIVREGRVSGVTVETKTGAERIEADLVVDATGKVCRTLEGVARSLFPIAYEETRAPWLLAALSDFQLPKTMGDFPAHEQEAIQMLLFLREQAANDPEAAVGYSDLQSWFVIGVVPTSPAAWIVLYEYLS